MKKQLAIILSLISLVSLGYAGTSNTVKTDIQSTDQIPIYRPSLGGTLGAANSNAYFRATLGDIISNLVGSGLGTISTWRSGAGAPSNSTGNNGDFYMDTTAHAYYGPKANGSWSGTGPISLTGNDGAAGVGVPVAGTTGQALVKNSNTDYDTKWVTIDNLTSIDAGNVVFTPSNHLTSINVQNALTELDTKKQTSSNNLDLYAGITPSANVLSFIDASDYSEMRTLMGLVYGTDLYSKSSVDTLLSGKQNADANLATYASITPSANIQSFLGAADYSAVKTLLGLNNVTNYDTTNPANIVQTSSYRFASDTEKSTWNGKQDPLGFTAENSTNKATSLSSNDNTHYPTVAAIVTALSGYETTSALSTLISDYSTTAAMNTAISTATSGLATTSSVTSGLALKAPIDNPTFTTGVTSPSFTSNAEDGNHRMSVVNTKGPVYTPALGDIYGYDGTTAWDSNTAGYYWYNGSEWVAIGSGGGGASINDTTPSLSTTYSSTKINTLIPSVPAINDSSDSTSTLNSSTGVTNKITTERGSTATLTNKTIDASSNTINNLAVANIAASSLVTTSGISAGSSDSKIPTWGAVLAELTAVLVNGTPMIAITTPASSGTWVQSATYTLLAGTSYASKGITDIRWKLGSGGTYATTGVTGTNSWSVSSISLAEGANTVYAKVTDTTAAYSETSTVINVDTINPTVSLGSTLYQSGSGLSVPITSAMFTEANPSSVTYWVDSNSPTTWVSPYNTVNATIPSDTSNHTIHLSVTDLSGRTGSGTRSVNYAAAPTISSIAIASNGTSGTITCSENMAFGAGGNGGLVCKVNGTAVTTTAGTISTTSVPFTISGATIYSTDTVTFDYTNPTNGLESSTTALNLASFAAHTVTNNSTQTPVVYLFNWPCDSLTASTYNATDGGAVTVTGSSSYVTGVTGNGIQFTSGSYGRINASAGHNINFSAGTIEFDYKYVSGTPTSDTVIIRETYSASEQFFLRRSSTNYNLAWFISGNAYVTTATQNIFDGNFHHIKMVWNCAAQTMSMIIDGTTYSQSLSATTVPAPATPQYIYFNGSNGTEANQSVVFDNFTIQ